MQSIKSAFSEIKDLHRLTFIRVGGGELKEARRKDAENNGGVEVGGTVGGQHFQKTCLIRLRFSVFPSCVKCLLTDVPCCNCFYE